MTDTAYNDDQLVSRFIELRDWLAAEQAAHDARLAPTTTAMKAIEGELHNRLIARGQTKGGTPSGTFYTTETLAARVVDREAFLDHVFSTGDRNMIAASVTKDSVKEYQDKHGANPPGVEAQWVIKLTVRRK